MVGMLAATMPSSAALLHRDQERIVTPAKTLEEELSRNQAVKNCLQQSGNSSEADLQGLVEERKQLDGNLIENKGVATHAREYYMHVCRSVKSSGEISKEYNEKGSLTQEESSQYNSTALHW